MSKFSFAVNQNMEITDCTHVKGAFDGNLIIIVAIFRVNVVRAGLSQQLETLRDNGKSRKANWSPLVNKVQ